MMKTANRKRCVTFHFSVEGETEAIYLEWLQGIINTANETSFSVRFDVKVCPPYQLRQEHDNFSADYDLSSL